MRTIIYEFLTVFVQSTKKRAKDKIKRINIKNFGSFGLFFITNYSK